MSLENLLVHLLVHFLLEHLFINLKLLFSEGNLNLIYKLPLGSNLS